jgi:thiamine biosynthesis protein ThiI
MDRSYSDEGNLVAFPSAISYLITMKSVVVVHHHEITLKRDNRAYFERHLLRNVRGALSGIVPNGDIGGGYGRFVIHVGAEERGEEVSRRLETVFGIANICLGFETEQSIESFNEAALHLLSDREFGTIRVDTRRIDKRFLTGSMEVNTRVGEFLCKRFGVRANLRNPDETVFIEIVDGVAYVYRAKMRGAGGLPSGISGRVISLLSAGFDSPVASWNLMKRGATVVFVHFHSMPYTSQESVEQVRRLVEVLTRYQFRSKLYLVPFAEIQNEIVLHAPQGLRIILYRRMMVRIAEAIAARERAEALVTGEAVGQVASQTLRNIRAIDAISTYPILRPLSGADKEETMAVARRIGTYDVSKEPFDDCCSFLAPRRPETWADLGAVELAESRLHVPALVNAATERMSVEVFQHPTVHQPSATPI